MIPERATSPLEDGRDIVIYARGTTWGFRLPRHHTITVDPDGRLVELAAPDHGGGFDLEHLEESDGEIRVRLGAVSARTHGLDAAPPGARYAFPTIGAEIERLKASLVERGADAREADAWAQGASYDSHTRMLRARIRELRRTSSDA